MNTKAPLRESKITDLHEMEEIINRAEVCHIAFVDGDKPYVLPFNFGYESKTIYIHSASVGKKTEIVKHNNNVCINFNIDHELFFRTKEVACSYGMRFKSVVANGTIHLLDDYDRKVHAMHIIMKKHSLGEFTFNAPAINNINVYKIIITNISGKKYGY